MSLYNVRFYGEVSPGEQVKSVKARLRSLLRLDAATIDQMFSGQPVILKKDTDKESAQKFQQLFNSSGAVCTVEPAGPQKTPRQTSNDAVRPPVPPAFSQAFHNGVSGQQTRHYYKRIRGGKRIILTNIETVPGMTIVEHFGLVSGSTIRAKHVGRDIMASLKNLVGGELKGYTELLQESRREATERMVVQAVDLGANAIINVRYSTSSVAQGAAELYAYGTAVRVE